MKIKRKEGRKSRKERKKDKMKELTLFRLVSIQRSKFGRRLSQVCLAQ